MATFSRRRALQGLGVGAVFALAGCTNSPLTPQPATTVPGADPTETGTQPNRLGESNQVDAAVFAGAFGTEYVRDAAELLSAEYPGVVTTITPVTDVTKEVGPSFAAGGTPPDLVDNSGPAPLPLSEVDNFTDLGPWLNEAEAGGTTLASTLTSSALSSGTFGEKVLAVNYSLSVYGLWYSASRFARAGWSVPAAWDDLLALGKEAKEKGGYLFVYADDAADYYQELAITSAIKEGGPEVRIALDSLAENGWFHPAVRGVLRQLETCVASGYVLHGGKDHIAAQAQWSQKGKALLYPAGAWIAKEMQGRTSKDFEMTVSPVPTLTSSPVMAPAAAHVAPTEAYVVPAKARNIEGGKALLAAMLNPKVAESFTRTNLIPTVVRNSLPADVTATSLSSQTRLIADAGDAVFTWRFPAYYGLTTAQNALWQRFLSGRANAETLAERLQALSDKVRNDPSVERYPVS